jgi:anthranilate synthase component 1
MLQELLLDASQPVQTRTLKVMVRELPADLETPVSAFLKLEKVGAKILLESVESGTTVGRYSFIGIQPSSHLIVDPQGVTIENSLGQRSFPHNGEVSPLAKVKDILSRFEIETDHPFARLLGGAVGYIGYDFVRFLERLPDQSADTLGLPLASLYLIDTLLVFDHVQRRIRIMSLTDADSADNAEKKTDELIDHLRSPLALPSQATGKQSSKSPVSNFTSEEFCSGVKQIKEYIRAGDIYQLVLSQRLTGETQADPFLIYRALRMLNPSPYMFYLDIDDIKLIGSSPEALVRLENGLASVRPIAGTRPRGKTEKEDRLLGKQLLEDEKERAEHIMLVDLGRNDLGRCCKFGSVTVPEFMEVERYSHVMHITSNVTGTLKPGLDQFDLFHATFPAGTVSGAPKIRAMQLIEELEGIKRGPYAGAVGYFSLSGDMDWCIAIRTIIMKGNKYYLQAGAGIVADSVPENEFTESNNKIAALKKAIDMAEEGF